MKSLYPILFCALLVSIFFSCVKTEQSTENPSIASASETQLLEPSGISSATSVTLTAVGDNLLHNTVINAAKVGNTYDFTPYYEFIKDYIQDSDIAVINQEAPLGGSSFQPSGYPRFNSPQEAGRDLVTIGFNVISHANNHAMDKGAQAVYDTIDFWDTYKEDEILMTGIYRNRQERDELRIMTKNDISVGFLSYTYGTNGIPLPSDNPDLVSLIDRERISYDMNRLVPKCDLTVVIMHWGNEYTHIPTAEQQELAKYLTELGAGIIIGHHPHVIQPAEWIEADNGNKAFCAYSLGNFISAQDKAERLIEGMLTLTIKKENNIVIVENPKIIPLVNYYDTGAKVFRIYPLAEYTDEIAATHKIPFDTNYANTLVSKILGEYIFT